MASIKQNPPSQAVPDFRNLGVVLRTLLLVNAVALLAALARNAQWIRLPQELVELAAVVEPPLIGVLVVLYLLQPVLQRVSFVFAWALILASAAALAGGFQWILTGAGDGLPDSSVRALLWSIAAAAIVLAYFRLRGRAYSPALAEARLMALTARIRPHFLFNSLNAVLGVIRTEPRRAEAALEELSDLFRVLMQDHRDLTTLGEEMALCRQYLDLERLRLGERLVVQWHAADCPEDALVPPLMLQPLLENAVYHGIEPAAGPGEITIAIARCGDEVVIEMSNPCHGEGSVHSGNRMALDNIRERLMLFFDLEARLDAGVSRDEYRVRIRLPYRKRTLS